MDKSQNAQQFQSDRKGETIGSLVFGIISIISILGIIKSTSFLSSKGILVTFFLSFFVPIIGIVLGIKGLKSPKRYIAILGVVLSIIGLFGLVILLLVWLGFATGM